MLTHSASVCYIESYRKGGIKVNIYINENTDADLIKKIIDAAEKNNRSVSFVVREAVKKGLKNDRKAN